MIRFAAYAVILSGAAFITGCGGADASDCAPNQYFDQATETCMQMGGGGQCPPGQVFNGAQCVPGQAGGAQCPPGQVFNGAQCVPGGAAPPPQCPAGQQWNGSACAPMGGPAPAPASGGACQVQNIGGAGGVVADQAIKALASQHIPPGSRAMGGPVVGNFQAGQCLELPINVNAGKCYTVVGASVGAITDLDVQLVPNLPVPGLPQTPLAQDQGDGPTAVLGGKPNCWTAFAPGPMKLIVRVEGGQGMAGAQIYEK